MGNCVNAERKRLESAIALKENHPPRWKETVPFRVTHVIDGDTVCGMYMAHADDKTPICLAVRLDGVDTPEKNTPQGVYCKMQVENLLQGKTVQLYVCKWDKWGGRIDGALFLEDGRSVSQMLLDCHLARPYRGERKPEWTREQLARMAGAALR